jgi:hypothetical protein
MIHQCKKCDQSFEAEDGDEQDGGWTGCCETCDLEFARWLLGQPIPPRRLIIHFPLQVAKSRDDVC